MVYTGQIIWRSAEHNACWFPPPPTIYITFAATNNICQYFRSEEIFNMSSTPIHLAFCIRKACLNIQFKNLKKNLLPYWRCWEYLRKKVDKIFSASKCWEKQMIKLIWYASWSRFSIKILVSIIFATCCSKCLVIVLALLQVASTYVKYKFPLVSQLCTVTLHNSSWGVDISRLTWKKNTRR